MSSAKMQSGTAGGRNLLGFNLQFAILTILFLLPGFTRAAETAPPPKTAQAWTREEATAQLWLNPEDVYLQFVALQLARNEGKSDEIQGMIDRLSQRRWGFRPAQDREVDLFALFTGALAVQESLQLDALRGPVNPWLGEMVDPAKNTVKIAALEGPSVKSHPWDKMLAAQLISGKKPEIGPLDLCAPEDQYYLHFRALSKLLDILNAGDLWGSHLFAQAEKTAKDQRTGERIKKQLAIETDPLSRPFYDLVVEEAAVTGSDIFFREGSDVTLLFQLKQPEVFKARMDAFLAAAEKSRPDAVRSTGRIGAVEYVSITTPDRAIHAFSAYPKQNLHVRSNSKAGLEKILKTIAGDKDAPRLGDATEFKYIRTLMPRGDEREDGLVYLSDSFIRRLVGPELKLTEMRRILCYNHLRMIGHAAMLYRTQFGKTPASLEELTETGCAPGWFAPKEGKDMLACPCGGRYSLAADRLSGVCSHHGNARELTPCREIPLDRVTENEAAQYRQFVEQYSQYWRRYFDPIVIRLQVTPRQYRAETIILPLIDNSIYTGMAMALGGEPEPLDALPVPQRNIFSVALRVNKESVMNQAFPLLREVQGIDRRDGMPGMDHLLESAKAFVSNGIGNQIALNIYDASPMFDFNLTRFLGEMMGEFRGAGSSMNDEMIPISFLVSSLNSPVYISAPVKDEKIVDKFLDDLDKALAVAARQKERGGWFDLDYDYYRVPAEGKSPALRCFNVQLGPVKWRVFFARIEGGLYVASKKFILDDLAEAAKAAKENPQAQRDLGPTAHAMVRLRPENWKETLPDFKLGWAEGSREACLNNLGPLSSVARAAASQNANAAIEEVLREADALHGVHFYCPDGGKYEFASDGGRPGIRHIVCPLHGNAAAPRQLSAPAAKSPLDKILKDFHGLTAELTFLEDGLHATATIERK
ncbi:MAG: hypothetical protein IT426_16230 [Pirellulales bacterium]|nr:hypothetical protein [Pirellulales bacterium]